MTIRIKPEARNEAYATVAEMAEDIIDHTDRYDGLIRSILSEIYQHHMTSRERVAHVIERHTELFG